MNDKALNILKETANNCKTIAELNDAMSDIKAIFESRQNYLTLLGNANELSKKGFGYIKESFENISPALYATNNGKSIMKEYIDTIKGNKSLKDLYSIYENIYHAHENANASYIVNEAFKNTLDTKVLNEGLNKLGTILAKAYISLGGHDDAHIEENRELNESIDYLATHKHSLSNVSLESVKRGVVENYITENAGKNVRNSTTSQTMDESIATYNKKYSSVNEEDATLIKKISSSEDKKGLFEEFKQSCLSSIEETIKANADNINIERINEIKEALQKKEYNEETIGTDIANFIQLKETIEN